MLTTTADRLSYIETHQQRRYMRKLTTSEFVEKVQSRLRGNLDLSEFEYINNSTKSTVICPVHGRFQATPNSLMNGYGCVQCSTQARGLKRRTKLEDFVTKATAVHCGAYDYSKVELDGQNKVTILCPKHGEFKQKPSSHMSGRGCPACGKEAISVKSKMPQSEFLRKAMETHGDRYDLSKAIVSGLQSKIVAICREHGEFYPTANNFLNGSGCPKCARSKVGAIARKPVVSIISKALKVHQGRYGYGKITYKDQQAFLKVICPVHGVFSQRAQDHLKGIGCRKCAQPVHDLESFKEEATLVHGGFYDYSKAQYVNAAVKVEIVCPEHGSFWQLPACHVSLQNGCPRCAKVGPSSGQVELFEFISKHAEAEMEFTLTNSRQRLDIAIPSMSLAFEYHGLIWHSTKFSTDARKDFKKHKLAESEGIRILHVYQDEWENNRKAVENTILSALGRLPKISARDCVVVEISSAEASAFYAANHLQGGCTAPLHFALCHNGGVVACMSFGVARSVRKNSDRSVWELFRYAATCTVVGGASRLLTHFKRRNLEAKVLVSYSDTRMFSGKMYERLGFTRDGETPPDYKYTNGNTKVGRVHKSRFQRRLLPSMFKNFDPNLSEAKNCLNNGWYQIFDCGKVRWVLAL